MAEVLGTYYLGFGKKDNEVAETDWILRGINGPVLIV